MMKGWIKCGLAGAVVLMASFWGGSVRAAGMPLGPDDAVAGLTTTKTVSLMDAYFLSLGDGHRLLQGMDSGPFIRIMEVSAPHIAYQHWQERAM